MEAAFALNIAIRDILTTSQKRTLRLALVGGGGEQMDPVRVWMICLALLFASCGAFAQQESTGTAAAFEVPLPTDDDKAEFIALLQKASAAYGYHVDAASPEELRQMSEVSPISFNATVWRGNDEEVVASAMDLFDHIGRVWLSFFKGKDPERFAMFRAALVPEIERRWPGTASLPLMPTGAIPLANDLIRTPSGYAVKPSARQKISASIAVSRDGGRL